MASPLFPSIRSIARSCPSASLSSYIRPFASTSLRHAPLQTRLAARSRSADSQPSPIPTSLVRHLSSNVRYRQSGCQSRPASTSTSTAAFPHPQSPHPVQASHAPTDSASSNSDRSSFSSSSDSNLSTPAVARWLYFTSFLTFSIVVVGGLTRLTESGLSITEWKPVKGMLPPRGEAGWEEEFAKYRDTE